MVVHACISTGRTIFSHHRRCHGNDGQGIPACFLPNAPCSLESVHLRHLYVHQHGIEVVLIEPVQRFLSVIGDRNVQPHAFEQVCSHQLVGFVVLDQQNSRIAYRGRFLVHIQV